MDRSIAKECLKTIEKIQFGYELDSYDAANLDALERLLEEVIKTNTKS